MKRLKYLADINPLIPRDYIPSPNDLISFLPMEKIGEDGSLDLSEIRPASEVSKGYTAILDGDLVIAKITPCFENGKGALCYGLQGGIGFGTTELIVLRAKSQSNLRFLYWLTKSYGFRKWGEAEMRGSAGQKRVTEEFVSNFRIIELNQTQQHRIAAYLDEQTAKIDRLINLRQRQMALLKEQRAALIQQAVTRGLNPNVPMKDSGLSWLGEIPRHWEVKRLKYLSKVNPSIPRDRVPKSTDEVSFLPMERVGQDGSLDLSEKRIANDISHGYTPMINGDVIVAKITPCFENGKGALCTNLIGGIGFGTTELIVLRANYEIDPRFLFWRTWCRDFRKLGESEMQGSAGQKRVTEDFISNFYLAKPPVKEQQEIIEFINNQNIQFEKLNFAYSRQITLLAEYRAALIHECVTGQRTVPDNFNPGASEHD